MSSSPRQIEQMIFEALRRAGAINDEQAVKAEHEFHELVKENDRAFDKETFKERRKRRRSVSWEWSR